MNRRQVLLGSAAAIAASALPVVEQGIMPFPEPPPVWAAAYKMIWDAKLEVFRVTGISFEELYINGDWE